ncbi:MAG: type II secretion system protein [Acidobacteriota bacterium]
MKIEDRPREAGFTLVMVVIAIAIMSIMMGVAVQAVSFQMQREREAELIFRGKQYVEAIRIYKAKYGRNPMRMKEIWEADPKVIRKKWKDPITDSENWGIIFMGQERQVGGRRNIGLGEGTPLPTGTPGIGGGAFGGGQREDGLPDGVQRNPDGEIIGPIVGVHSTSCDESIKIYEGRTTYCEWRFFLEPDRQGGGRRRSTKPREITPHHAGEDPPDTDQPPGPYPTGTPGPTRP